MSLSTKNIILMVFGRIHAFEEKKIVKTVNLKFLKFSFSLHFSKMCSRRQTKLITIYRIPGFSFFISSQFQCNIYAFNMRFHVLQKRIAMILLPIFEKLQFVVSLGQKASQGTISCFWNKFLSKNYNRQNTDNGRSSITSCAYRDFISCNIIVDFWYCLACCVLYSTKSKEMSMKLSASTNVSLKYRQRIFYTLLRAYWFCEQF